MIGELLAGPGRLELCFYGNLRSELFTPRGDENRRASRAWAFRAVAIALALARRRLEACQICEALGLPDYGRLPTFAGN